MQPLINIKKAPLEVATILAENETLIKLLYNSSPNTLNEAIELPNVNDLIEGKYINFYAPTEYGIEKFDRTAFISIFIDNIYYNYSDKNANTNLTLYFCTKTDNILLANNKNRLLEAVDNIWGTLYLRKLSAAGEIIVNNISYVFLDDFHVGYRMSLSITDQQNRKVDF